MIVKKEASIATASSISTKNDCARIRTKVKKIENKVPNQIIFCY